MRVRLVGVEAKGPYAKVSKALLKFSFITNENLNLGRAYIYTFLER